jgi:16S rRNA processing protein RimM
MTDDYIRIAVAAGAHGLNGRLKILVISDIRERFDEGNTVFIKTTAGFREFKILNFIEQKGRTGLLELEGINDRDAALSLKGSDIFIDGEEAERTRGDLDENSFYYHDVIGCTVYCQDKMFGTVTDILEAGSGEILIISDDRGKQFMVPFVGSMVETNNIRNRRLDIYPVEGLFEV